MSTGRFLGGLVIGSLIGAGIALLTSPKNGKENRDWITAEGKDRFGNVSEELQEQLTQLKGRFDDTNHKAREKAHEAMDQIKESFGKLSHQLEDGAKAVASKFNKGKQDEPKE